MNRYPRVGFPHKPLLLVVNAAFHKNETEIETLCRNQVGEALSRVVNERRLRRLTVAEQLCRHTVYYMLWPSDALFDRLAVLGADFRANQELYRRLLGRYERCKPGGHLGKAMGTEVPGADPDLISVEHGWDQNLTYEVIIGNLVDRVYFCEGGHQAGHPLVTSPVLAGCHC